MGGDARQWPMTDPFLVWINYGDGGYTLATFEDEQAALSHIRASMSSDWYITRTALALRVVDSNETDTP